LIYAKTAVEQPNYFIPADTEGINTFSRACFNEGLVQQFAYSYALYQYKMNGYYFVIHQQDLAFKKSESLVQ
jgi:hypothetical protein